MRYSAGNSYSFKLIGICVHKLKGKIALDLCLEYNLRQFDKGEKNQSRFKLKSLSFYVVSIVSL